MRFRLSAPTCLGRIGRGVSLPTRFCQINYSVTPNMLPTNVLLIEGFCQDTNDGNDDQRKKDRLVPSKLAVRPDPDQTPQVGERLERPTAISRTSFIQNPTNAVAIGTQKNSTGSPIAGSGHPRVTERKGDRILRRSPECVTVALEHPNMHQVRCKMVADAVPASLYNSGKFRIIQNRRFDRLDSANHPATRRL